MFAMTEDWLTRVERRAAEIGMGLERLATEAGLDRSYFRKARERRGTAPRASTLDLLATVLGVERNWIILGDEVKSTIRPTPPPIPMAINNPLDEAPARSSGRRSHEIQVPEIDVRAGAGGGGIVAERYEWSNDGNGWAATDAVKAAWGLPETFLRYEARITPGAANIVEIVGDSMFDPTNPMAMGTLLPGDRAIIDSRDCMPSPPGAFAVWDGFGIVVKMIEFVHGSDPPRLRLSSRNPAYQPYEVLVEEAKIIGRVRGRITVF